MSEAGVLQRVTQIASVSGGSALAAHLVLNWVHYCTPPTKGQIDPFEKAARPLLELIQFDVRNRILRRIPWYVAKRFLFWILLITVGRVLPDTKKVRLNRVIETCTSVHLLRVMLDDFFGDRNLARLGNTDSPTLAILATEVSRMTQAWFTHQGFDQPSSEGPAGADLITIGLAVAASAAFPAVFPPVRLDGERYLFDKHKSDRFITDAGVYDNLGISGFLGTPFPKTISQVFVSDATATRDWESGSRLNILTSLLRSVDIIQQRGADLQRDAVDLPLRDALHGTAPAGPQATKRFVLFDIADDKIQKQPNVPKDIQRHLSYIRTDFDAFSVYEGRELVHHGYSVAWHNLKKLGLIAPSAKSRFDDWSTHWPWPEPNVSLEQRVDKMVQARRSRMRLFAWTDPFGFLNTCVLVLIVISPWIIWYTATKVAHHTASPISVESKWDDQKRADDLH